MIELNMPKTRRVTLSGKLASLNYQLRKFKSRLTNSSLNLKLKLTFRIKA